MTATMVTLDVLLNAATALAPAVSLRQTSHGSVREVVDAPIIADRDLPPFDRAAMDGFALRHAEFTDSMPCAGRIDAGALGTLDVPAGACVSIATGAPVPASLDAVVPHEATRRTGDTVCFDHTPEQGSNIHARGVDARCGDTLVQAGAVNGPAEIGLGAACGVPTMQTLSPHGALVLTSGDEVVPVSATPLPHQIRNSNGPMVCAILNQLHLEADHVHLPDSLEATVEALKKALDRPLLVATGGVSAGERDFVGPALEALGIQWTLVGAAVKPGKPIRFGRLGDTSVVCLPGNPVAALIMGTLVLGCIAATQRGQAPPEWTTVPSADALQPNPQRELLRTGQVRDGQLHVQAWQGSGDLAHTAGMNAVARLPIGRRMIPAGTPLPVLLT